jgi:hypothetical protein
MPISHLLDSQQTTSKKINIDDILIELIEELEKIDENSTLAKLNETSISDNNGSRIFF